MMSPKKAAEMFRLNPATDVVVICEIMEAGSVLADEIERLQAENADLDAICSRLSFGVDDTEDNTCEAAKAAGEDDGQ
jgi:uncharacterized small protein (DUF1192 family)